MEDATVWLTLVLYSLFPFQSLNSRVLYEIHIILIVHIPSCKPSERKRPIPYPRHCRCCPMSDCGRGGSNYRTLMVYCGEPVQPIAVILILTDLLSVIPEELCRRPLHQSRCSSSHVFGSTMLSVDHRPPFLYKKSNWALFCPLIEFSVFVPLNSESSSWFWFFLYSFQSLWLKMFLLSMRVSGFVLLPELRPANQRMIKHGFLPHCYSIFSLIGYRIWKITLKNDLAMYI